MPLDTNNAGLLILGASSFPRSSNFQSDSAFLQAKLRVKEYFVNPQGLNLQQGNILDLFDSDDNPNAIDEIICSFIESLKAKCIQDLFIYYVGHGGFSGRDRGFFLAIKGTRDSNLAVSSITIRSLSGTITHFAANFRTYFIIDCCFSGEAGTSFMSGGDMLIGKQLMEDFPAKGVALLCSSSRDLPSLIVKERNITMFTEGFDMALRKGDSSIKSKYLSLRQLHQLTYSWIKQLNPGNDIRPEILSPVQPMGDIAEIPNFFNNGYKDSDADIIASKREIEGEMIKNNLINACNLFIDFVRNFDLSETFNAISILIGSDCHDLEEERNSIEKNIYRDQRNALYVRMLSIVNQIVKQIPLN